MTRFDGFVILAGMRTGSNFLEETLNTVPGLCSHGEVFNPGFIGQHDRRDLLGMTLAERDADPLELLRRVMTGSRELSGFRLFPGHAPEVRDAVLNDPRIGKIILSRDPLESFISLKIAEATDQWRLTDERHRRTARVRFDAAEFDRYLRERAAFRSEVRRTLQHSGQAPFEIRFEELADLCAINGMLRFLGVSHRLDRVATRLKRQNPAPLREKVENFEEMQALLSRIGTGGHGPEASWEPSQAPALSTFVAAPRTPLLFMPIKGGPTGSVTHWMAALDGVCDDDMLRGFSQQSLRRWKSQNKRARTFTVVAHPLERAHAVYRQHILAPGPERFSAIRDHLCHVRGLCLPADSAGRSMSIDDRRRAFVGFLDFLKDNLNGLTPVRTDPAFSSQLHLLRALAEIQPPDMVVRADQAPLAFRQLRAQVGRLDADAPEMPELRLTGATELDDIYDASVEAAARGAYNRDYAAFGCRRWRR